MGLGVRAHMAMFVFVPFRQQLTLMPHSRSPLHSTMPRPPMTSTIGSIDLLHNRTDRNRRNRNRNCPTAHNDRAQAAGRRATAAHSCRGPSRTTSTGRISTGGRGDRPSNDHARVNDIRYPVTLDALYTIFSVYGTIDKIVTFDKGRSWSSSVPGHRPRLSRLRRARQPGTCAWARTDRDHREHKTQLELPHERHAPTLRRCGVGLGRALQQRAADSRESPRNRNRDNRDEAGIETGTGLLWRGGRQWWWRRKRKQKRETGTAVPPRGCTRGAACATAGAAGAHRQILPLGTGDNRACHNCGEVGHLARNCPRRNDSTGAAAATGDDRDARRGQLPTAAREPVWLRATCAAASAAAAAVVNSSSHNL